MTRYLRCTAPEWPVPSIVDYRPKSTLVTPEHPVPKAKYPAVDVHGHIAGNLASAESLAAFVAKLDAIGVGVFISADQTSGANLQQRIDLVRNSPYKDRVRFFTGLPVQGVGPGWAEKAVAQLEADVKAGALGVGEVSKGFGMTARKADGTRLAVDEPIAGSVLGRLCPPRDSGVHPYRGAAGVLQRTRHAQRTLARVVALRRPPQLSAGEGQVRAAHDRTEQPVPEAPEDKVHCRASRLARAGPWPSGKDAR